MMQINIAAVLRAAVSFGVFLAVRFYSAPLPTLPQHVEDHSLCEAAK
jgi:hypothetical protein